MNAKRHTPRYSFPLSNEIHPPMPVIHDGSHTALERRFEEEIVHEEEKRFIFPHGKEQAGHGS